MLDCQERSSKGKTEGLVQIRNPDKPLFINLSTGRTYPLLPFTTFGTDIYALSIGTVPTAVSAAVVAAVAVPVLRRPAALAIAR